MRIDKIISSVPFLGHLSGQINRTIYDEPYTYPGVVPQPEDEEDHKIDYLA